MIMMMMSRFVEHIINGPQTRCRSAEQVGLQMSSERQWGKLWFAGRLVNCSFLITGPATAKLIPSMVLVLGTDSILVPVDCKCRLPAMPSTSVPVRVDTCKLSSPTCTWFFDRLEASKVREAPAWCGRLKGPYVTALQQNGWWSKRRSPD